MNPRPLRWTIDAKSAAHAQATFAYEANPAELDALKRYVDVDDLTSFTAKLRIAPAAGGKFKVSGTFQAYIKQSSVVSLEAVSTSIEESFSVEYWPAGLIEDAGEELSPFEEDRPEPIVDGSIAIGALLCELLAVSVDPYPRNEGDEFEWKPPRQESGASPFAELARLRRHKDRDEESP